MTPQEYAKQHQKAFRVAFDFLNEHFPPGKDPSWWDQAAKDLSQASIEAGESRISTELLTGVFSYLGYIYEGRKNNNGNAEN